MKLKPRQYRRFLYALLAVFLPLVWGMVWWANHLAGEPWIALAQSLTMWTIGTAWFFATVGCGMMSIE